MLTKWEIENRRRAQPKEILKAYLKKTLSEAGYTKEQNFKMYQKFEDLFCDYYWDTSNEIRTSPAFDAMGLADNLLFEISREVKFRANQIKDHLKTKALVETLSTKADQVVKENKRLTKVLEELEEQRSSSDQSLIRRLTQDLKSAQAYIESLRGGWGGRSGQR